jgi:5,10-methylenetetrahydromethanopterin reductase
MRMSLYGGADSATVNEVVRRVRAAADAGWSSIWFSQGAGLDTHTALAAAAVQVPKIRLGSAVVPIQGRHPIPLAQQALTVSSAAGEGRFAIGIGVTHAPVSEGWYGIPYRQVVDQCAEYLPALAGLLRHRKCDVEGEFVVAHAEIGADAATPRLLVGALAPRMLRLAGHHADGTITWMTGPRGLAEHVVPAIQGAAREAGRADPPEVVVGLPVCVTDDPHAVRDSLLEPMARTAGHASYARMVALEGVEHPADLAIIGPEDQVLAAVDRLRAAGASELLVNAIGTDADRERTAAALACLG